MASVVLFFLTFVDEFRYISIKLNADVTDRRIHPSSQPPQAALEKDYRDAAAAQQATIDVKNEALSG